MLGSPSTPENVDYASGARINAVKTGKFAGASDRNEEQGRADAASTCALWCTIAMGALVQGQPPEQVRIESGPLGINDDRLRVTQSSIYRLVQPEAATSNPKW